MSHLSEISLLIASEISSIENRQRKRSDDAQKHFEHAIERLLTELWLGTVIHPEYEAGIHRRSNWYSETPQYRDPNLTYPQAIAAYDGMVATDFIRVVRDGYFDRDTGKSDVTKVIATDKLLQFIKSDDAPVLPVHDSFIMHHAFGEELGELEEAMRRAFYEHFKKDINLRPEIGVMLPSSFDGKDSDDLTIEQVVHGPPEYSQWEERNS